MHESDLHKAREIRLAAEASDEDVASAAELLRDADGVEAVTIRGHALAVRYDLRRIGLEIMEEALAELGFALDAGVSARLQRALVYYTEENQRANHGIEYNLPHATRDAYVDRWRHRPHGCRDHRPGHWRRYW